MEQGSKQDSDGIFHGSKLLDKEGKSIRRNRKRMFIEWGETGIFESTEQHVVIRQGQSETMVGYQNLNWKQQKDKYKMNPRVSFVESKM